MLIPADTDSTRARLSAARPGPTPARKETTVNDQQFQLDQATRDRHAQASESGEEIAPLDPLTHAELYGDPHAMPTWRGWLVLTALLLIAVACVYMAVKSGH